MRPYVNHFQPSFKLAGKEREGSRVRKRYHKPAMPYARLIADDGRPAPKPGSRAWDARSRGAAARHPRAAGRAGHPGRPSGADGAPPPTAPSLEQFLSGLRTARHDGEVQEGH